MPQRSKYPSFKVIVSFADLLEVLVSVVMHYIALLCF